MTSDFWAPGGGGSFFLPRNLLIYLECDVQQDVIELFRYSLNTDGRSCLDRPRLWKPGISAASTTGDFTCFINAVFRSESFTCRSFPLVLMRFREQRAMQTAIPSMPIPYGTFIGDWPSMKDFMVSKMPGGGQQAVQAYSVSSFETIPCERFLLATWRLPRF